MGGGNRDGAIWFGKCTGVKNILLFLQGRLERCGYERFRKPHQFITNQQFTITGLKIMRISEIEAYIYNEIVPRYSAFDNAHKEDHALTVIRQSEALLEGRAVWLAEQAEANKASRASEEQVEADKASRASDEQAEADKASRASEAQAEAGKGSRVREKEVGAGSIWNAPVDRMLLMMAAACHDLGLVNGRENHHLDSGIIIRRDTRLRNWFSEEEIETIAQAAEDHRASGKGAPRSIYGMIVAEADRVIEGDTIIRRTIQYGQKHYPDLCREEQIERAVAHLKEKYGRGGYLKLWIPWSDNAVRLNALQDVIADDKAVREKVAEILDSME
jgi:uncharacterized protein